MRNCIGQQPFKYFVETDPTVPMFVKKITLEDIQNWNTVLNKQDKLTAGEHIIIDNNVISFDHTIDLPASDFNYFKIGDERIYNDLRNYFITINEEEFIPIDILTDTAFMQWQDGLYVITEEFDIDNDYKVVKNNVEYDVMPYWARAIGDPQVFIDLIESLDENETLAYYKEVDNETVVETLSIQEDGDEKYLADSDGVFVAGEPKINALFEVKEFVVYNTYTASVVKTVYVLSDYDVRHPEEVELNIIVKVNSHNKVQPTDEFDSTATYYIYNRLTDTYSTISLNETTFKQRQNGLYIRNAYWDADTLLTAKNIDQLMYDIVDTAYSKKAQSAYSNFVTNELKSYVNGRISTLNLSNYATTTALTNLNNKFNIRDSYYNDKIAKIAELSSTREYLITTGNGLKKTYVNEGTLNQVAHLDLDIRRLPDGYLNEEVKKYLHLENGYNGFYIFNDLIYQDWQYVLDANGNYIPDGEGGWQKEQLDHYILGMPFTQRLVPARVAVSSQAVLEELNDNYEMKLITLGSNVQIVDLAYYKQLWGVTGAVFTEADFKALTAEWYDVNWDSVTPENQAIMKMYTYNGENGERLYRHQRAITFIPSDTGDIYAADVYTAIENPTKAQFDSRTEPWYIYDSVNDMYYYVSLDAEFDSEETYYTLGSQQSKFTIPSCDAVAKFVESLDLDYTGGKVKLSITERPNTINERVVNIDEVTIVDDSVVNTNNTWSSKKIDDTFKSLDAEVTSSDGTNVQVKVTEVDGKITDVNITTDNTINSTDLQTALLDYVTLATNQTISGSKTFSNANTFTNQIILQGVNSMIVGSPDGITKKALLQRTSLNNTNLIVLGNTSDTLELRGSDTRPTYNTNEQLALLSDVTSLPNPMIFKGSIGNGGTIEWANLPASSSTNNGWTYKVIEKHATAIASPTGNPKNQKWFELNSTTDRYDLTNDTTVVIGKTYYENASNIGDIIVSNYDRTQWENIPSGDEPSGTVTSIGLSVPTGLQVSNSPITSSGTLAITYASGYAIPTTSKQTDWDNKIAGVQLNGTDLTIDANKKVNVIAPQVYRYV